MTSELDDGRRANVIRYEGGYWIVSFDNAAVRLRDSKGWRHIVALLRSPDAELHVSVLATGKHASGITAQETERMRKQVSNRIREKLQALRDLHPSLWRHLEAAISTGACCAYRPVAPVRWTFR